MHKPPSICRVELFQWGRDAAEVLSIKRPKLAEVQRLGLDLVEGKRHGGEQGDYALAYMSKIMNDLKPMHYLL